MPSKTRYEVKAKRGRPRKLSRTTTTTIKRTKRPQPTYGRDILGLDHDEMAWDREEKLMIVLIMLAPFLLGIIVAKAFIP